MKKGGGPQTASPIQRPVSGSPLRSEAILDRSSPGPAKRRARADHDRGYRSIGNPAAAAQVVTVEHVVPVDPQFDVRHRHDPQVQADDCAARIGPPGIVDNARLTGHVNTERRLFSQIIAGLDRIDQIRHVRRTGERANGVGVPVLDTPDLLARVQVALLTNVKSPALSVP